MLTRRHIRIKVMQALYGFFQSDDRDMAKSLKNLQSSLDGIYNLYLYELKALVLLLRIAEDRIETNRSKNLPTKEDLNPNLKFVNNSVLRALADNKQLEKEFEVNHINWSEYRDMFTKIYRDLLTTEEFQQYMDSPNGLKEDKRIAKFIYGTYISENEDIHAIYEEMNMHWADDLDAAQMMVVKTIKILMDINGAVISKVNFDADVAEKVFKNSKLPSDFSKDDQKVTVNLFKEVDLTHAQNEKERLELKNGSDKLFGPQLFTKTINNAKEQDDLISEKTKNWEADRIALIDNVLLKMAQTELTEFNEIPIRVTMNEYIELSKMYSTPKSSQFINGVLDQISIELKAKGGIKKIGRGLM